MLWLPHLRPRIGAPKYAVADEPPAPEPEEPEPFVWHTSARGNPWAQYRDWHIVVFPDRGDTDQWVVRVQQGDRRGRYLSQVWPTPEDAQDAVERALTKRPSARYVAAALGLSSL